MQPSTTDRFSVLKWFIHNLIYAWVCNGEIILIVQCTAWEIVVVGPDFEWSYLVNAMYIVSSWVYLDNFLFTVTLGECCQIKAVHSQFVLNFIAIAVQA